jgi:hypothetical protein
MRSALLSLVALAVVLPGAAPAFAPAPPQPKDTLDERVREAIQNGLRYLRNQERDGKWETSDVKINYPGGFSCLALLALLSAGESPDSPVIQRGLKYLRTVNSDKTYVVALQTMVFARAGEAKDRKLIQRNADWLLAARLLDGWTYNKPAAVVRNVSVADNSNTQYALLGLEAARRAGAKVDRKALEELRKLYLDTQVNGGWSYRPREQPTLSMTAAGLCGLVLTGRELDAGLHKLRADGSAENCGRYPDDGALDKALEWVGGHFPRRLTEDSVPRDLGAPFYTLAGIGRAGRLTGRRYFGEADWYEVGARYLLAAQKADGSWGGRPTGRFPDYWPVVATSYALLFLTEGRTPVLVAKLAYGPPAGRGWDNQRDALRHLVEFSSRELFKKRPLAWQVFDVRRRGKLTGAEVKALAAALREAPVVFLNGHALALRGPEEAILKEYLARGGLVFAEACCGEKAFDRDFRALMKRLFPDDPLRPLPPGHPLWKASDKFAVGPKDCPLEAITRGGRVLVIYSPKPLAGYWEADDYRKGRGEVAFQVGASVIAYATGRVPLLPRGHSAKAQR